MNYLKRFNESNGLSIDDINEWASGKKNRIKKYNRGYK